MVKRHGYRIELGEIEVALYRHPDIEQAAVIGVPQADGVMIHAYLTTKSRSPLSIIALKQFCHGNLPSYMSPDRFVFLPFLPRTATDKVDYQQLLRDASV
jgi:acyl-coenzyme A synthetase/AMP-(fatty) acid ligase